MQHTCYNVKVVCVSNRWKCIFGFCFFFFIFCRPDPWPKPVADFFLKNRQHRERSFNSWNLIGCRSVLPQKYRQFYFYLKIILHEAMSIIIFNFGWYFLSPFWVNLFIAIDIDHNFYNSDEQRVRNITVSMNKAAGMYNQTCSKQKGIRFSVSL